MEKDAEIKGEGNSYTTEFRQYDPRLGRWLSLDPLMPKFPGASPYSSFSNNPIIYKDSDGDYSIQVIKKEDGSMELHIVTTGYVKGELKDKVLSDFHASYPEGYSDQGEYIDDNGVKWTITVQIDMKDYSEYDGEGSIVDTDCLPPSGQLEWGVQNGSEVCAAAAGLALHGLWHNTGGNDCYQDDGAICERTGLMDNPKIRTGDFYQIGYKLIDDVPENLNNTANTKQQSVTDYIQSKGEDFTMNSVAAPQFIWDNSYPGGSDQLIEVQNQRMQNFNSSSNNQESGPTEKGTPEKGKTSVPKFR